MYSDVGKVGIGRFTRIVARVAELSVSYLQTANCSWPLVHCHPHSATRRVVVYHCSVVVPEDEDRRRSALRYYAA